MSTTPYFLRNPALDDAPPSMAPPTQAPMAPVNPTHAMTAPLGPTHDAAQGMMQAASGMMAPPATEGAAAPPQKAAPKPMAAKQSPLQDQEDKAQSKLMGDYAKDADPYGSPDNHPGFFGKLLHGLNVATGGVNRRAMEENTLSKGIQGIEAEKSKEGLEGATAGHLNEETSEMPGKTQSEEGLQGAQTGNLKAETAEKQQALDMGPSLATAYAHRVNEVLKTGGDPSTDPITQRLQDAITSLQKPSAEQGVGKTTDLSIGGKVHTMGYDAKTGKYDIDEGLSGFKPAQVSLNLGREEKNDLLKAYQPTLDSAERMNVMTESYEKAVKDHDQQAMLNLLANHLGMTMGLQKGARMTKDIIHEAQQSQPWLQGMEAKFDKDGYLAGVTLSPNQMRQMVGLGQERYAEDAKKSRATAQYLGAKDDGPQRIPGKATINYYLGQANGDPAKAKQLAAQDGWTISGSVQ